MEREIKFRAWDKRTGRMHEVGQIDFGHTVFCYVDTDMQIDIPWDKLELMQYTGLKDKDGTEIYEGDIVIQLTSYEKREERCVIKSDGSWFVGSAYASTEWQVIGNIYENPELLEDTT